MEYPCRGRGRPPKTVCVLPGGAFVIVPADPPSASAKAREDWGGFVHMFHRLIENFDGCIFFPANDPSNVTALKGLVQGSKLQNFFTPLTPFPRLHFYTVIPSGISAPRPVGHADEASDKESVGNWRASVGTFLEAAMRAAPHSEIPTPAYGPDPRAVTKRHGAFEMPADLATASPRPPPPRNISAPLLPSHPVGHPRRSR